MIIFKGGRSAASMRKDVKAIAKYANKVLHGEGVLPAEEEGYYGRGIRHQQAKCKDKNYSVATIVGKEGRG